MWGGEWRKASRLMDREVGDFRRGGGVYDHGINMRRGLADFGPTVVETVG